MSSYDDSDDTQLINGLQTTLLLAIADDSDGDLARKLLHVAWPTGRRAGRRAGAAASRAPCPSDADALEANLAATDGWDQPSPQQVAD